MKRRMHNKRALSQTVLTEPRRRSRLLLLIPALLVLAIAQRVLVHQSSKNPTVFSWLASLQQGMWGKSKGGVLERNREIKLLERRHSRTAEQLQQLQRQQKQLEEQLQKQEQELQQRLRETQHEMERGQGLPPVTDNPYFHPNTGDDAVPAFPPNDNETRVAICLVGEARDFHLTGPSILRHLLTAYPHPHLFLHSPLDEKAYRFLLLARAALNVTIAAVRIFPADSVDEKKCLNGVVGNVHTSSCQGLLQQFRLIQGCLGMIGRYEEAHGFRFNWILRTRTDSFWTRAPPSLHSYNPNSHTIPHGSDFGGLNDRLSMGRWRTSRIFMSPLTLPRLLLAENPRLTGLNPESMLSKAADLFNVTISRAQFWFCVVTHKRFSRRLGSPTADLASGYLVPLNGAKCRPCTPYKTGTEAVEALNRYPKKQRPPVAEGVALCLANRSWENGWERVYDKAVGPELAELRKQLDRVTEEECIDYFEDLKERTWLWDAPSPEVLCLRRRMGPAARLGQQGESFPTFLEFLVEKKVEARGKKEVSIFVHANPRFQFFRNRSAVDAGVPPSHSTWFSSLSKTLWSKHINIRQEVFLQHELHSTVALPPSDFYVLLLWKKELKEEVDRWQAQGKGPKTCQLLHTHHPGKDLEQKQLRVNVTAQLKSLDFQMDSCIQELEADTERCTYFSTKHCS